MQNIHDYISQTLADYKTHEVELADGLYWSQYDELKTLEYLITNHFEQGDSDPDTGLPKPFFDVITRLRLNQSSAEDIDIADLQLGADDPKYYTQAWVLSKFNRVWMKEGNMNDVLDDATLTRGDYGGVLLKVTENDEDLFIDVVNWHQIVTDPNDIPNGVKIEKHNFTPAELMDQAEERGWDVDKAQEAIATAENTMDDENSTDKCTWKPRARSTPRKTRSAMGATSSSQQTATASGAKIPAMARRARTLVSFCTAKRKRRIHTITYPMRY
jgi:hypothetical protein